MDTFDKELFSIIQSHHPTAKVEDFNIWSESKHLWASRNYQQAVSWIDRTFKYLDGGLDNVDVEKFIINAHGLIVDLPAFIEKRVGIYNTLGFSSLKDFRHYVIGKLRNRGMQVHLFCLIETQDTYTKFLDNFSSEEIFATTFFRNSYCHPVLSAYAVTFSRKKGGAITFDPARYEAFQKVQPYDEVDLCKALFDKFSKHRDTLNKLRALLLRLKG